MRERPKFSAILDLGKARNANCPLLYEPEDFILPEDSVKSFKGPYKLKKIQPFFNLKKIADEEEYNCDITYEYGGTRQWDQRILEGQQQEVGIFQYNLQSREFGPLHKNNQMLMPLKDPLLEIGNLSANQKKLKNISVFELKNNFVLRKPPSFPDIKENIPFFSILKFQRGPERLNMNVTKMKDSETDKIDLRFGMVSNSTDYFNKLALASQCLELSINNNLRIVTIEILQNTSTYYQKDKKGMKKNTNYQPLLCAFKDTGQQVKLTAKDLLEITMQMIIHIGNIFALVLDDHMHFLYNETIQIGSKKLAGFQHISIGVINLALKGYTKYEEYIADLRPAFKYVPEPLKNKKARYLHPLAYRFWASRLPSKKVKKMEDGIIKDSLFTILNGDNVDDNIVKNVNRGQQEEVLKMFPKTDFLTNESTFKDIFEALLKAENIKKMIVALHYFKANDRSESLGKIIKEMFGNYHKFDTDELTVTYYLIAILKSAKYTKEDISRSKLDEKIISQLKSTFGDNLIDKNVNLNFFLDNCDSITAEAINDFIPFKAKYITNNFTYKITDLSILKWETNYKINQDDFKEF